MSLEDDFCDIIKKSRHGQSLSLATVAQESHLPQNDLEALEKGSRLPSSDEVNVLSQVLHLRTQPLTSIVIDGWTPKAAPSWIAQDGLVTTVLGDIGGYEVKGYLLSDLITRESLMIDTGYNAKQMLETLQVHQLNLKGVCLTHGHTDHAGGLDEILERWPVPVYLGKEDVELLPWTPPQHLLTFLQNRQKISIGSRTLECLATPGHTPGGFCFRLNNNGQSLCFVGDTLFAGSVGRSNPFTLYPNHLLSVRNIVLTLENDTVLLPGHGPSTTVQEEQNHNPFA
ncbi:MBL fold metallo-hydrolase [Candidatus Nitrospira salsa]